MEVAEQGRLTALTPPARLIERCDCPPGYAGLSCEVSWLPLTLSSTHFTSQMEILPQLSWLQFSLFMHILYIYIYI